MKPKNTKLISSTSLKEIREQLQPSDSEDNSKVEWKVSNI